MTPYHQLIAQIIPGVTLSLKEYDIRRNKRHLTLTIENSLVHDVIPANTPIGLDQLEQYYGAGLSPLDYAQLACVNCFRAVLLMRIDENNQPVYKPIFINQDFYESGLQEISIIGESYPQEPIYAPHMVPSSIRVPIILTGDG